MKQNFKPESLPAAVAAAGLLGLGLHRLLYRVAMDEYNLPVFTHPLHILLMVLSVGVAALIVAVTFKLSGTGEYAVNFPAGPGRTWGSLVFAGCIFLTVLFQPCAMAGQISQVWRWLGLGAALSMTWVGVSQHWGKVPNFALYLLVCLFLGIHLVTHYQLWSSTPLVWDYIFPLLGGMTLLFYTYYQMAFTVGFGRRRKLLAMGLLSIYLGLSGLLDTEYPMLWLGSLYWVWTSLCAFHVPPAKKDEPKESAS